MTVSAAQKFTAATASGPEASWISEENLLYGEATDAEAFSVHGAGTAGTDTISLSIPQYMIAFDAWGEFDSLKVTVDVVHRCTFSHE